MGTCNGMKIREYKAISRGKEGGVTPFEAMTGRTAPSSDGLLVEVFWGFPQLYGKCQEFCAQPPGSFRYHPYH